MDGDAAVVVTDHRRQVPRAHRVAVQVVGVEEAVGVVERDRPEGVDRRQLARERSGSRSGGGRRTARRRRRPGSRRRGTPPRCCRGCRASRRRPGASGRRRAARGSRRSPRTNAPVRRGGASRRARRPCRRAPSSAQPSCPRLVGHETRLSARRRRTSTSSGWAGICSTIHASTSKKRGSGSPRTSTGATSAGSGLTAAAGRPRNADSVCTAQPSWRAATRSLSSGPNSWMRRNTRHSAVGHAKTPSMPGGTSPDHPGPVTRNRPPRVPLVRGDT